MRQSDEIAGVTIQRQEVCDFPKIDVTEHVGRDGMEPRTLRRMCGGAGARAKNQNCGAFTAV